MPKIILDSEPSALLDKCPFSRNNKCFFTDNECPCIGGYYDSLTFDFSKCNYCTVLENKKDD